MLEKGRKRMEGPVDKIVSLYVQSGAAATGEVTWEVTDKAANNGRLRLVRARILCEGVATPDVVINQPVTVQYDFEVLLDDLNVCTSIHLNDKHGNCILATGTGSKVLKRGLYQHACVLPANFLNDVPYTVEIILLTDTTRFEVCIPDAISFMAHEIEGRKEYMGTIIGCVRPRLEWSEKMLQESISQ
jgi:hypothetical protein